MLPTVEWNMFYILFTEIQSVPYDLKNTIIFVHRH